MTTKLADLLREKREEILALAERHGARDVRVFGSRIRLAPRAAAKPADGPTLYPHAPVP